MPKSIPHVKHALDDIVDEHAYIDIVEEPFSYLYYRLTMLILIL